MSSAARSDRTLGALIVALVVAGCVGAKQGSIRNDASMIGADTGGAVGTGGATGGSGGSGGSGTGGAIGTGGVMGTGGTGGGTGSGGATGTGGAGGTSTCKLNTSMVGNCTLQ